MTTPVDETSQKLIEVVSSIEIVFSIEMWSFLVERRGNKSFGVV